jgi:hypothetical protein
MMQLMVHIPHLDVSQLDVRMRLGSVSRLPQTDLSNREASVSTLRNFLLVISTEVAHLLLSAIWPFAAPGFRMAA